MNLLPNGKPISALGFGCSALWAKPWFPEAKARAILDACESNGINHFDTGPSYGIAEERLARFLRDKDPGQFVVSTKVGTPRTADGRFVKDWTVTGMEASLAASLQRLGVERVDILYLHGGRRAQLTDEVYRFFEREKQRGRILYSGLNSFEADVCAAAAVTPIDVAMLQYNVADLSAGAAIDQLKAADKVVICATPLAQGVVSPRTVLPVSPARIWYLMRALRKNPAFLLRGARLRRILRRHGLESAADPLRFVSSDPRFTSAVFGTTSAAHVQINAVATATGIDEEVLDALRLDLD